MNSDTKSKSIFSGCYVKEQSPLFFPYCYPRKKELKEQIQKRINEIIKFRVQLIVDKIISYLFHKGKYRYEYEYDFKDDEYEKDVMIEVFKSLNILGIKCEYKKKIYLIRL